MRRSPSRSPTTSGKVATVKYATANGTTTAGSDYVAGSGSVTFPAGSTMQTITVVFNGDLNECRPAKIRAKDDLQR